MNQPSREPIRSDLLVRDFKLAIGSIDNTRGVRTVRPRRENSRARSRYERDCLQRTDDREKEDERGQRECVHLECVEN